MRLDESTSPRASTSESKTQDEHAVSRHTTVEDVPEDDVDTSFAPGGDADYYAEEDEEGRFYGGGLTSEQKDILSVFERAEREGVSNDVSSFFFFFCVSVLMVIVTTQRAVVFR